MYLLLASWSMNFSISGPVEIGKVLTGGIPAGGVILAPFGGGGGTYP